jgi:hypothetical protein
MKLWSKRLTLPVSGVAAGLLAGVLAGNAVAQTSMATPPKDKKAGEVFKAVTTSTLKELNTADFLASMGVMAAALGYDCADCHPAAGSDKVDWSVDTPKKKTARKMTEMVAAINKANFAGTQAVTCWTCHHGRDLPATTIALDALYGPPSAEKTDVIAAGQGVPTADQIFDKYLAAVGGAQKLGTLKSYIATGTSLGYEGIGGGGSFQILAQSPDMRATKIVFKDHPERGDSTRTFDGKAGWVKSPRGLLSQFELAGTELDGARLDALLSFPGQIKADLTNWRVGAPDTIGEMDVYPVQGRGARGFLATLYFDTKSGYLVRVVRYGDTPIGHVPVQMDFGDYRDVQGMKFPFQYTFSWLDGRDQFKLTGVQINPKIDAAVFGKP